MILFSLSVDDAKIMFGLIAKWMRHKAEQMIVISCWFQVRLARLRFSFFALLCTPISVSLRLKYRICKSQQIYLKSNTPNIAKYLSSFVYAQAHFGRNSHFEIPHWRLHKFTDVIDIMSFCIGRRNSCGSRSIYENMWNFVGVFCLFRSLMLVVAAAAVVVVRRWWWWWWCSWQFYCLHKSTECWPRDAKPYIFLLRLLLSLLFVCRVWFNF